MLLEFLALRIRNHWHQASSFGKLSFSQTSCLSQHEWELFQGQLQATLWNQNISVSAFSFLCPFCPPRPPFSAHLRQAGPFQRKDASHSATSWVSKCILGLRQESSCLFWKIPQTSVKVMGRFVLGGRNNNYQIVMWLFVYVISCWEKR